MDERKTIKQRVEDLENQVGDFSDWRYEDWKQSTRWVIGFLFLLIVILSIWSSIELNKINSQIQNGEWECVELEKQEVKERFMFVYNKERLKDSSTSEEEFESILYLNVGNTRINCPAHLQDCFVYEIIENYEKPENKCVKEIFINGG